MIDYSKIHRVSYCFHGGDYSTHTLTIKMSPDCGYKTGDIIQFNASCYEVTQQISEDEFELTLLENIE